LITVNFVDTLSVNTRLRGTLVNIDFTVLASVPRFTNTGVSETKINAKTSILARLLLAVIVAVDRDGDVDVNFEIGFDVTIDESFVVDGRWLSDVEHG
jgi:hypothetical protein